MGYQSDDADGHLSVLKGLCGYVWANIFTSSPENNKTNMHKMGLSLVGVFTSKAYICMERKVFQKAANFLNGLTPNYFFFNFFFNLFFFVFKCLLIPHSLQTSPARDLAQVSILYTLKKGPAIE